MKYIGIACSLFVTLFVAPAMAHALVISEIQYDPVGVDAGQEWIEIYNDGSGSVDITGFKLFENNVNHGIAAYTGTLIIPAGEYAVIADQPAQVAVMYPDIDRLYDSAFSLNNTGETLILKNAELEIIDTVNYVSTDGGTDGGSSLNKVGGSWVARLATPGEPASSSASIVEDEGGEEGDSDDNPTDSANENDESNANPTQNGADSAKKKEEPKEPLFTLSLAIDDMLVANDPVMFEGILKKDKLKLLSGRFEWSLGDGTYFTEGKLKKFTHTYESPGTYVVVLEYYKNFFDDVPFLRVTKTITVTAGSVIITDISDAGMITFENSDEKNIDLAGWKLESGISSFVFGKNTFVVSKKTLSIPASVHKLSVGPTSAVVLRKPDGTLAIKFPKPKQFSVVSDSSEAGTVDSPDSVSTERARIIENNQQAKIPSIPFTSRIIWMIIGLGGILILCIVTVVVILRGKQTDKDIDTEHLQEKKFSFDEIELLN